MGQHTRRARDVGSGAGRARVPAAAVTHEAEPSTAAEILLAESEERLAAEVQASAIALLIVVGVWIVMLLVVVGVGVWGIYELVAM